MAEELQQEQTTVETDYIQKLQELKQNSVSREEYDRVRADNKKMLDAMFSGTSIQVEQPKPDPVDIQGLRDELYGGKFDGTDLDYMSKTLQLRKAIMDNGGEDPAVSKGNKTEATYADYETCAAVCDLLQNCVDEAQGDPALFRTIMTRELRR